MHNNNYEDYIRSILGYTYTPNYNSNMLYQDGYQMYPQNKTNNELEDFYPEIYKIIYPMIKKVCNENIIVYTNEEIEKITNEIYNAVEEHNEINVNINSGNTVNITNAVDNKFDLKKEKISNKNIDNTHIEKTKEEQEIKNKKDNYLSEIIKILLIRELKEQKENKTNNRKYISQRISQTPPYLPLRPPVMPINYEQSLYDIYEY